MSALRSELEQRNPELEDTTSGDSREEITISNDGETRVFTHSTSVLEYGYGAKGEVNYPALTLAYARV